MSDYNISKDMGLHEEDTYNVDSDELCGSGEEDDNEGAEGRQHGSGDNLPISQEMAKFLYEMAGEEDPEEEYSETIHPTPHILSSQEEILIKEAMLELKIDFQLDNFHTVRLGLLYRYIYL